MPECRECGKIFKKKSGERRPTLCEKCWYKLIGRKKDKTQRERQGGKIK